MKKPPDNAQQIIGLMANADHYKALYEECLEQLQRIAYMSCRLDQFRPIGIPNDQGPVIWWLWNLAGAVNDAANILINKADQKVVDRIRDKIKNSGESE